MIHLHPNSHHINNVYFWESNIRMKHYDYIFAGAGLSALMTVYRMLQSGDFTNKSILLIDANNKKNNDRTWCFWEKGPGAFEPIITARWRWALFADQKFSKTLDLAPYEYKMIRGIAFYDFVFKLIATNPNVSFINEQVADISDLGEHCTVVTPTETFSCSKIFNSVFNKSVVENQREFPVLQQHFIGWFIKTDKPAFNPDQATFMDFSIPQNGNTRFMYVLPTTETEALFEYTLFSKDLLSKAEYENAIADYIKNLGIPSYEIVEKERGSIPMTSYPFWKHNTKNIINIGSAGGWTKASTGYTFKNTVRKSAQLVMFLKSGDDFTSFHKKTRFWFYDLLLLDILSRNNEVGSKIFASMFKNAPAPVIFKFLDEETTFIEDLRVILACPKSLFINALMRRLLKRGIK